MPDSIKKDDINFEDASDEQKAILGDMAEKGDAVIKSDDKGDDEDEKGEEIKDDKVGKETKKAKGKDEDDDDLSNLDDDIDKELSKEKKEDDDEDELDDDEDDDDDGEAKGRKPTSVPIWKHLKVVRNYKKKLQEAQVKSVSDDIGDSEIGEELQKEIDALSEETGIQSDSMKKILTMAQKVGNAPLIAKIKELEGMAKQVKEAKEDADFEKEFDSKIKDSVVEEHGEDALPKIKKALQRLAFTSQYAQVPLAVIYNGIGAFRGKKGTGRGTLSEGKKGGRKADQIIDFSRVSESDIDKMDDKTFNAYGAYLKAEGKKNEL